MRQTITAAILLIFLGNSCNWSPNKNLNANFNNKNMKITTNSFQNDQKIPAVYTCDGAGKSPALDIEGTPPNAQSLVLIVDDPDAPMGTWTHWTIWNIDPGTTKITENTKPANGIEGMNSGGSMGYYPPCPPSGTHRYFFNIFALDINLSIKEGSDVATLKKATEGHILDSATIIGLYR